MGSRSPVMLVIIAALVLGTVGVGLLLAQSDDDDEGAPTPTQPVAQATSGSGAAEPATATAVVPGTPRPAPSPPAEGLFGFGQPASEDAIAAWDIDIPPSGEGLPEGSGSVEEGAEVYASQCAACHGATGTEGGLGPQLVSEPGPYQPGTPRTIGSYWPYATTVWDYINRAMPFDNPGTLSPDEVYAVTAWLLNANGIVPDDAVMDAESLPQVQMPNQPSFFSCWPETCRPDVQAER